MITFNCPRCSACHQVKDRLAGASLKCLKCNQGLKVPDVVVAAATGTRSPSIRAAKAGTEEGTPEVKGGRGDRLRAKKPANALRRLTRPKGAAAWGLVGGGGVLALCLVVCGVVFVGKWIPRPAGLPSAQANGPPPQEVPPPPPKDLSVKEISTSCSPSVAQIENRFGTGSGFLIGPGLVVTNAHVIDGDLVGNIKVRFPSSDAGDKAYLATLVYEDRARDLAVLKINSPIRPVPLATAEPDLGEEIVVIGSPGGAGGQVAANTVTTGVISNKNIKENGKDFHQLTAPVNPGNSGGPVFNRRGQVVGVATGSLRSKQAMNYAIPLGDLRKVAETARQRPAAEQERVGAEHDFIEVFRRVAKVAEYCNRVLALYCKEMSDAEARGEHPGVGAQRAAKYDRPLAELIARELEPILPNLTQITSNKAVSEVRRRHLQELWDVYREAKNWIDRPRGTLMNFKAKTRDLTEKTDRLIHALKLDLGLGSVD